MNSTTPIIKHSLSFSIRTDALVDLDEMRQRVAAAIGCALEPAIYHGMEVLRGEVLGMRILLLEWRGIARRRTFQLHGTTELPESADPDTYPIPSVTRINDAVIDLLRRADAGEWRVPSDEEVLAESQYSDELENTSGDGGSS